ncbi:hypothetical protein MKEN_00581900 [Mycena kentingensis (nom. inval.)]|nr:hypothetical protein MKEN_00581900 [Mycena kentingensis (nom. inval.)]
MGFRALSIPPSFPELINPALPNEYAECLRPNEPGASCRLRNDVTHAARSTRAGALREALGDVVLHRRPSPPVIPIFDHLNRSTMVSCAFPVPISEPVMPAPPDESAVCFLPNEPAARARDPISGMTRRV